MGNAIYYLNNKFILLKKQNSRLIQLSPFKSYSLNKEGSEIICNLGDGKTFEELTSSISVRTNKNKEALQKFLAQALEYRIITTQKQPNAALRIIEPSLQPPLERIFMEVTSRCNFYCKHCYMSAHQHVDTADEMTLSEIKQIISWAHNNGIFRIDFTGGELFVRKDIKEILKYSAEKLMITNIFTNGFCLTKDMCDFLSELGNIKIVFVSLDDIDPEKHDAFRGMAGSYARVIEGISYLKSLGIRVVVNITLNNENSDHIKQVIDYCRNTLGVECRVAPIMYVGRGKCFEESKISSNLIVQTMDYSIGDQISYRETDEDEIECSPDIYEPSCGVGFSMLYIRANGELCLCPTLSSRESNDFYLGNIRTHDIKDIWQHSPKLERFRNSQCKNTNCKYMSLCRGGCRSRAYLQKSQLNDVDQIVCDYFSQIHSKKYIVNPHCEFTMREYPVAIIKNNEKTIALSNKNIAFLKLLNYTECSFRELVEKYQTIDKDIDASNVIHRFINEKLLVPPPKYKWNNNHFGASLVNEEEIASVENVLKSKVLCRNSNVKFEDIDYLTPSPCYLFEKQLSKMIGTKYVTVLNSGTSALECALKAIGVSNKDDEIIIPCYTYIGTVAAVLLAGGKPILCDINETYSIDSHMIESLITPNTKAIIVVHLRGRSADVETVMKIADKYGISVIEDCAQAIGCHSNNKHVGSIGHIGCFSFHEHKLVSTGEGGAIVTNSCSVYDRIRHICDASRVFAYPESLPGIPGHNYRMSEIQAAIGLTQIKRLPQIRDYLVRIYKLFYENLSGNDKIKVIPYFSGDIPQSIYIYCGKKELADNLVYYISSLGVPATNLFSENSYNHNIYIDWPYVMEMLGYVNEWKTERNKLSNLFPDSVQKLRNTINISLGMGIDEKTVHCLCHDIVQYINSTT